MAGRNFLFVPGPTNVPDRVTRAMMVAMEDHRSPIFPELTRACLSRPEAHLQDHDGDPYPLPLLRHRLLGGRAHQLSECRRQGPRSRFGQFSHLWVDMCAAAGV